MLYSSLCGSALQIRKDVPYLENAHNFFGKEGAGVGRLGHAHPCVVGQDDDTVHLGVLRLDQLLEGQVEGPHVVHKRIIIRFPFTCTKYANEYCSIHVFTVWTDVSKDMLRITLHLKSLC